MKRISDVRAYISTYHDVDELLPKLHELVKYLFKLQGVDITSHEYNLFIEDEICGLQLSIHSTSNKICSLKREQEISEAAQNIGLSEFAEDNFKALCGILVETECDYYVERETGNVIFEMHAESGRIMDRIHDFYHNIDNMNAKEAKLEIAAIYADLKNQYGWG